MNERRSWQRAATQCREERIPEMTVYAIAQLKMTDRAAYDRYQAHFFDVFRQFNGHLLAADEHPRVLEGTWPHDKLVMMSFRDEAAFLASRTHPTTGRSRAIARWARRRRCCWSRDLRRPASGGVATTARSRARRARALRRDKAGSKRAARNSVDHGARQAAQCRGVARAARGKPRSPPRPPASSPCAPRTREREWRQTRRQRLMQSISP